MKRSRQQSWRKNGWVWGLFGPLENRPVSFPSFIILLCPSTTWVGDVKQYQCPSICLCFCQFVCSFCTNPMDSSAGRLSDSESEGCGFGLQLAVLWYFGSEMASTFVSRQEEAHYLQGIGIVRIIACCCAICNPVKWC